MVARTTDGELVVYAGNGKDSLTRGATLPGSFSGTRFARSDSTLRRSDVERVIDGFAIGHHTADGDGWLTGTTVVLAADGAVGGVDVRGGGPGTRETDLLDPRAVVERVHAVVLTGGSAYGLAAADGVMAGLEAAGIGFPVGPEPGQVVPIVPAAVIFDLGRGGTSATGRPPSSAPERSPPPRAERPESGLRRRRHRSGVRRAQGRVRVRRAPARRRRRRWPRPSWSTPPARRSTRSPAGSGPTASTGCRPRPRPSATPWPPRTRQARPRWPPPSACC